MNTTIDTYQKPSDNIKMLHQEILACRQCQAAFGFEPHPIVFGTANAKIVQIGQAPSLTVHNTGKPFNDASGRRLRSQWYRISDETFYNPDNFYIVSIAHCYPGKLPGGGDRRPPSHCADRWLMRELQLVHNELYILIGSAAAGYFFPKQKLTSLVFQNRTINGKPAFVLPHPSPLNMNWFRDHPEFEEKRMPEIAQFLHKVLRL